MATIQSKLNLSTEASPKKEEPKGHIIDPKYYSQPATIPTANDLRNLSGSLFGDVTLLYKQPLVYMDGFKTAHIIRRLDFGEYLKKVNIFGAHTPVDQPFPTTILIDQFTFQHYRIAATLFSASIVDKCVKAVRNPSLIAAPHFPLGILSDRYAFFIAPILSNSIIDKNLAEIPIADYKKMAKMTYDQLIEKARAAGVDASDRKQFYCKDQIIYSILNRDRAEPSQ